MILRKMFLGATIATLCATFSAPAFAADAKEEVTKAAKALGEKANYSWKTTVVVPESAPFKPGPTEGKADKEGTIYLTMTVRDNMIEAVKKGEKAVYTNQEGDWQLAEEGGEGPGRFMASRIRNFKAPTREAAELAGLVKELKKEGDVYSGELTEAGAKTLMSFRGRAGGGEAPEIKGAKGSAKFWIKEGILAKYEYSVKGQMNFQGNDVDMDRTTTTEIKDIDKTKVVVPEAAKKKLG